jgi:hypothetical protein
MQLIQIKARAKQNIETTIAQTGKNADMLLFLKKMREKSTNLILFGGKKRKKMRTGDFLRKRKSIKKRKSMNMLIFLWLHINRCKKLILKRLSRKKENNYIKECLN